MAKFRPLQVIAAIVLYIGILNGSSAQCTNTSAYPADPVTPDPNGLTTTITGCNWRSEYATIIGISAGTGYEFSMAGGAWVTVRQGLFNGPVLGDGPSPLSVVALTAQNLFVHWNTDSLCGTDQECRPTTVRSFGADCTPPEVSTEVLEDCENNQFAIQVVVVNIGDASSVGLSWTVNGGAPNNLAGLQAGSYQLGPFANTSIIDVTVVHAEQPLCNAYALDLTNAPCLTPSCGPDTYTFCYGNNENYVQTYQGDSNFPLRLQFNSGTVSPTGNDALTIRDGLLPTDPILFSGVGNAGNLTGVTVLSTNPDHALTLTFTSNSSFSCADGGGGLFPWNYTVICLDCEVALGSAGPVTTDCAAQTFSVQVNITEMGSASTLEITDNVGGPGTTATSAGTYTAGPFPVGTPVQLSLVDPQSAACTVQLGTFVNSFCPVLITCGTPALEQTFCYGNLANESWLYQNSGSESLAILFSGGSIESSAFDHLTIYDGDNDAAPVLYDHTLVGTAQLAGLLVVSSGPDLFMKMTSDNSISCAAGNLSPWSWTVGCLDCEQPQATYAVELDCVNSQFSIAAEVTSLGSDPSVTITNTGGAPVVEADAPGTYTIGPFPLGTDVQVNLVLENALCNIGSPVLTSAPCPLVGCGPFQFQLCYPNNMDTTIVYQGSGTWPIALLFNSGGIATTGDHIEVYDGPDFQAPLLYTGFNGGDLAGLQFTSTNPDHALCVRFVSNGFTSCVSGGNGVPWNWSVSCLDCTDPEATFSLIEDCLHNGFSVAVDVTNLGSAQDLRVTDSWSLDTLNGLGLGTTLVGPIPVGTTAQLTLLNGVNPLCRIISPGFFLPSSTCVVQACEPIGVEHCYVNSDTAWFIYQSGENTPLTVAFASGQLLDGDQIMIYNGLDDNAQLVFAGNFGGDISGFSLSSNNPDNALTFKVVSDASGSCATGEANIPMYWTVGCGLVGVGREGASTLSLYPNPATEMLMITAPGMVGEQAWLEIRDVSGRLLLKRRIGPGPDGRASVDVSSLPSGPYAVRLGTSRGVLDQRLEVVRP